MEQRNPFRRARRICDMRHLTRARCAAVGSLTVLTFAGIVFAGFAYAEPAAVASTTTTVATKFNLDCETGVVFCYVPPDATVSVGDTVLWIDQSGFRHTVTRCDPQHCEGHDGGTGSEGTFDAFVEPGTDFSHTFTGPGTYLYYCRIHAYAGMHGTITVAAEGTSTTSTTTTTTTSTTTSTTTPTSASPTTATARGTAADATPSTSASSVGAIDTTAPRQPLARTGRDLRLVPVGLSIVGVGVLLVSAGHRTRRRRQ